MVTLIHLEKDAPPYPVPMITWGPRNPGPLREKHPVGASTDIIQYEITECQYLLHAKGACDTS